MEPSCKYCFGRGFIFGPTFSSYITEAMEEPERITCTACNGTGRENVNFVKIIVERIIVVDGEKCALPCSGYSLGYCTICDEKINDMQRCQRCKDGEVAQQIISTLIGG